MEFSIQDKFRQVAKYFGWELIQDFVSIDGDIKKRGYGWYVRMVGGKSWLHESEIEKMYELIQLKEEYDNPKMYNDRYMD